MGGGRIWVEGPNDREAIGQLLRAHDISLGTPREFESHFEVLKGFRNFALLFPESHRRSGAGERTQIVVLDTDSDVQSRWQSVSGVLRNIGYTELPGGYAAGGVRVPGRDDLPAVGVWLMPGTAEPGALEEFALAIAPPSMEAGINHARAVVAALPEAVRNFSDYGETKAIVHTFLAWQATPGEPIGRAIRQGIFDARDQLAQSFIDWFVPLWEES